VTVLVPYVFAAFVALLVLFTGWYWWRELWSGLCWLAAWAAAVYDVAARRWRGEPSSIEEDEQE
jgi:hypothetical protein